MHGAIPRRIYFIFFKEIFSKFNIFINFKSNKESLRYSFLFILLKDYFNFEVPDEYNPLFEFAAPKGGVFILSLIALLSFITLFNTVLILYFKDK